MRVIVTGASGFLGRNVLLRAPRSWQITALYHRTSELDATHRGTRVKVHGIVTDEPILRASDDASYRFVIAQGGATLVVDHHGVLPDRFQTKLEVIVTGTLSDDGTRIATDELVAKCPDNYDEAKAAPR